MKTIDGLLTSLEPQENVIHLN